MAFPTQIVGIVPLGHSYTGPYLNGTNVYVPAAFSATNGTVAMGKATDPTSSFSEIDGANRPAFGGASTPIQSLWSCENGAGQIYIAGQDINYDIWFARFSMTTDSWVTTSGVSVDTAPAGIGTGTYRSCSIAVKSTNSAHAVIAYQGAGDKDMGTEYATVDEAYTTNSGTSWTAAVSVAGVANGVASYTGPTCVQGDSGRIHIFFKDLTNADLYQRCHRANDTLETFPSAFDTDVFTYAYIFGAGDNNGGTVRVPYADLISTQSRLSVAELTSADTPTVTTTTDVGTVSQNQSGTLASLSLDGTDEYIVYADSTFDMFYVSDTGTGYGTPTEYIDAISMGQVSTKIYTRSGSKVIGIVYYEAGSGNFLYHEIDITGATTHQGILSAAGSGTLTASGRATYIGVLSATSSGTYTALGGLLMTGTLSVNGAGTISLTGTKSVEAILAVSGAGSLSLIAEVVRNGNWSVAGSGTYSATGVSTLVSTLSVAGSGAATQVGTVILGAVTGILSVAGSGSVVLVGSRTVNGVYSVSGAGTLSQTPDLTLGAVVSLTGSGGLTQVAEAVRNGNWSVAGTGSLTASPVAVYVGDLAADGTGSVTLVGELVGTPQGILNVTASGAFTANPVVTYGGILSVSGSGSLVASGNFIYAGVLSATGAGNVVIVGTTLTPVTGILAVSGAGSYTTSAVLTVGSTLNIAGQGSTTFNGTLPQQQTGTLLLSSEAYYYATITRQIKYTPLRGFALQGIKANPPRS